MAVIDLSKALSPARIADGRYGGVAIAGGVGVAFGGHIAAQSLCAAADQAGADRWPHSIHSTFLSPIAPDLPVTHDVAWLKQGRAFSVLRVDAAQHGRVALTSVVSFHDAEAGPAHQMAMPAADRPALCPQLHYVPPGTNPDVRACFEIRSADIPALRAAHHPAQACWLRSRQPLGNAAHLHAAALIWFSDLSMPWTTDLPYGDADGQRFGASLDHSMWFHRRFSADDWLLFVQESAVYAGARALTRGMFFTERGELVASAAQETLVRRLAPPTPESSVPESAGGQ